MRYVLLAVVVAGCAGAHKAPSSASPAEMPAPAPEAAPDAGSGSEPAKEVAYIDPDDGGEVTSEGAGPTSSTGGLAPGGGASGGTGSVGGTTSGYGGARERQTVSAKVVLGIATVTGELDPAIVRRIFTVHRNELRYCYEQHLRADPSATGVVVAKLEVDGDGKVTAQSASGIHPDIEDCLTKRFATWVFPKPKTGTLKLTQPITFSPP